MTPRPVTRARPAGEPARPRPDRRRVARGVCAVVIALAALILVLTAGALSGRWTLLPVGARGQRVTVAHDAVAFTVPVPTAALHRDDIVLARVKGTNVNALYRVAGVDSWTRQLFVYDEHGRIAEATVGLHTRRVSFAVPLVGALYRALVGWMQSIALLFVAMFFVVRAIVQRRLRSLVAHGVALRRRTLFDRLLGVPGRPAAGATTKSARVEQLRFEVAVADATNPERRPWVWRPSWYARLAALVCACLGAVSLNAYAVFYGNTASSVSQGTIISAHASLSATGIGNNPLTLGAANIAPGDLMERAVDLTTGANDSGIFTGANIRVTASSSAGANGGKLDDSTTTKSLQVWIQGCPSSWTPSGSSPAITYTCSGTSFDVLGTTATNLPSAGTCPPASGTVSNMNTIENTNGTALSNITLTANTTTHLVVFMCLPTATDDAYQDASSTFTFNFEGVQRGGQAH